MFFKLQSYAVLRTRQLAAMVFAGVNLATVLRRLRKLEGEGYIKRMLRLEGYEIAWSVTLKGSLLVGNRPLKRNFRTDTIDHDLKLTDLRISLEGCGIAQSWIPEHEIRSKVARKHGLRRAKERIIPDGLMGVSYRGAKESVAIELELNFKNSGRYHRSFSQYQTKDSLWGVWYLVHSEGLGKAVEREWKGVSKYGGGIKFMWSMADEVLKEPLSGKVFSGEQTHAVSEIWTAQPPALALSRGKLEMVAGKTEASVDEHEEKLAPAS